MLIDTGAQISLIKDKVLEHKLHINKDNKILIKSIHGAEETLGQITTSINKNNMKIPIQLQVTQNSALREDGILGYDIIGDTSIIDGPNKNITINSGETTMNFAIQTEPSRRNKINRVETEEEFNALRNLEYLDHNEIHPNYRVNFTRIRDITQQLNQHQIRISKNKKN